MAGKQKPTILKSFFEGHRRKATLTNWNQTRDKRGIDTIKLEMSLPLLNEAVLGMNEEIGDPFSLMAKDSSKTDRSVINVEIKGMTLEVFSTGTSKEHWTACSGAHFKKLSLVSEGEDDKKEVNLHLTVYVPGQIETRDWAWVHLHKDFHLEAVYSQSEMDLKGETGDEDEEEEVAPAAPQPTGKRGPKAVPAVQ